MSSVRPRRPKVFYTKAAERDLEGIAAYTLEVWGLERRDRYLDMLERTCERIIPEHRGLGREVVERPGIYRWRAESHVIFFREVAGGIERGMRRSAERIVRGRSSDPAAAAASNDIEIVRVLHERMLASRHL